MRIGKRRKTTARDGWQKVFFLLLKESSVNMSFYYIPKVSGKYYIC